MQPEDDGMHGHRAEWNHWQLIYWYERQQPNNATLSLSRIKLLHRERFNRAVGLIRNGRIPQEYLDDPAIILHLIITDVGVGVDSIAHVSERLRSEKKFMLGVVAQSGTTLKYALGGLPSDEEVVTLAVRERGRWLRYASRALQANERVAKAAVQSDAMAYEYVRGDARAHPEIFGIAVRGNLYTPFRVPKSLKTRLEAAIRVLSMHEQQGAPFYPNFTAVSRREVTAYQVYADAWKRSCYSKLVAVNRALRSPDFLKAIVEFSDIPEDFRMANELITLAPALSALFLRRGHYPEVLALLQDGREALDLIAALH